MLRFLRDLIVLTVIVSVVIGGVGAWRAYQKSSSVGTGETSDRLQICTLANADWTNKRCLHPLTSIDRSMKTIALVWSVADQATEICVPLGSTGLAQFDPGDKALDSCALGNAQFFMDSQVGGNDFSALYAQKDTYDGMPKPGAKIDPSAARTTDFSVSPDRARLGVLNPFDWAAMCTSYDMMRNLTPSKAGQYRTGSISVLLEDFQGSALATLQLTAAC
jgi:hypothetical protein